MDFLPMPHRLERREGAFAVTWRTQITLTDTEPSALLYAQMLRDAVLTWGGMTLPIVRGTAQAGDIVLTVDAALPEDTYRLSVRPSGVTVSGGSDEALLHGVMTLRQHVQRCGALLPAIEVEDQPDLKFRGYYQDCSRGRVPTLETLKRVADTLCHYKINEWQLYVEHTYLFRELSEAWREDTPLTAEEIMELDAYCRARHIELVPSLASFGHMYQILSTKTCCDLCELPDSEKQRFSYFDMMHHHTLNVSHPKAMAFVKKLIAEYRTLFTSRKFNICCDETFDLGKTRSKPLADERGVHALYMAHVTELCRWLLDQGVTPMFWGDIIWRHPEAYKDIPEGTVCLNWGYLPNQPEDEIRALAEIGATQYACPGICTWNCWLPLLRDGFSNNRVMCQHAHKYGAIGLLNTDWGDYGHICQPAFSVPGILYGAAFAWNAEGIEFDEVNRCISFLEYGDSTGEVMEAFTALSGHEAFDWYHAVHWMEKPEPDARRKLLPDAQLAELIERAPADIAAIDEGLMQLRRAAVHMDPAKRSLVQQLTISAEGAKLWNEIGLYVAAVERGADVAHRSGADLAADLERWYHAYLLLWRQVSKESTLQRTMNIVCRWADYLRGR